jgi:hypothetical protein
VVSRRTRWTIGLSLAQLALLVATFPIDVLGTETWHHLASLAVVLGASYALRDRLTSSRSFLALGVLSASILATASGFSLQYFKSGLRVGGYQDWGVFWHIVWSWVASVFFVQHTWINRTQLADFAKRSVQSMQGKLTHYGAYAATLAAIVVTWSPTGREWFTNETYYTYSLRTWVATTVPSYAAWLYLTVREDTAKRLEERFGHWPIRRVVDLALVPAAALAVLSGFPLLFDGPIDPRGLKYTSKYWHVAPSIVFTVLVFVHATQAWDTVKAHWRS